MIFMLINFAYIDFRKENNLYETNILLCLRHVLKMQCQIKRNFQEHEIIENHTQTKDVNGNRDEKLERHKC